jgi:outer membrane protein OmpA-like peptidoglycan-associated protein
MSSELAARIRVGLAFGLVAIVLAQTGCQTTPPEDNRITQQCASIAEVVKKNYRLGSTFDSLVAKFGVNVERYGATLTSDATERLIQLNTLCRKSAVGAITQDEWAKAQHDYIVASLSAAKKKGDPTVDVYLKENLEELRKLSAALTRPDGVAAKPLKSAEELLARAKDASDEDIKGALDGYQPSWTSTLAESNGQLRTHLENSNAKLDALQEILVVVLARTAPPKSESGGESVTLPPKRVWTQLSPFRVMFAFDDASLDEPAKSLLRQRLGPIRDAEDYRIEVAGYTDQSGGPAVNVLLSQARADEVRNFLVTELLLESSRVSAVGRSKVPTSFGSGSPSRVVEVRGQELKAQTVQP